VSEQAGAPARAEITEEMVRDYLIEHGDFLQRHPDLMDHLHIEHASGSAVSLVEKQVSVLRERNVDMRRRLSALTSHARENDSLFARTRALVLELLEAESLAQLAATCERSLRKDFGVEYAALILFGDPGAAQPGARIEPRDSAQQHIGSLLHSGAPLCSALRQEQLRYLFPEAGATGSAALAPLGGQGAAGLLAVGSSDAGHYHSGMDTLFLQYLGDVVLRLLPRLRPPAA
jgi:uncharacterized protein YigA (DUF484 family)